MSFKELIYNLLGNVTHNRRNYEDYSKKTSVYGVLTKMFNLDLILSKQANPYGRTFSRTTVLNSSKVSMSWQPKKGGGEGR